MCTKEHPPSCHKTHFSLSHCSGRPAPLNGHFKPSLMIKPPLQNLQLQGKRQKQSHRVKGRRVKELTNKAKDKGQKSDSEHLKLCVLDYTMNSFAVNTLNEVQEYKSISVSEYTSKKVTEFHSAQCYSVILLPCHSAALVLLLSL